jgi:peroxiredoxin
MRTHLARTLFPLRSTRGLGWILFVVILLSVSIGSCAFPGARPAEEMKAGARKRTEPRLPHFSGRTLDGDHAGTELFRHRRGLLYIFATTDADAEPVAGIVRRLRADSANANIAFLGVNRDVYPARARAFMDAHGFDFPILYGADPSLSSRLGVPPGRSAVIVVDAEGYVTGGFAGLQGDLTEIDKAYESEVRHILHLDEVGGSVTPALGLLPKAPNFELRSLAGETTSLSELEGKVLVVVFFAPSCPHCHVLLKFLDRLEKQVARPDLRMVPVSVRNRRYVLEDMVEKLEIELPIYVDPDNEAQKAYAHRHTVPDTLVINREQRVVTRLNGAEERAQARITMEVRQALDIENPTLLPPAGYSGEGLCQPCHRDQHQPWVLTNHAYAFDTLIEHGAERDPECLPCHTVGWNKPGGYSLALPYPYLEGVQCESCHGRGGPHESPDFLEQGYQPICETCHTPKHSLGFRFAERRPEVSHNPNLRLAGLSLEERKALLTRRDKRQRVLFDEDAYVGSAACQSCHETEYELWEESAHARAFDSLSTDGAGEKPECLRCHTTGFHEPGGFPEGGGRLLHVGCESCHGPGGTHIEEDSSGHGDILALGDKCDTCVILQICGSCHDDENDPGFEFVLMDKLDRIRHGLEAMESAGP